ncbi:MAG: glucokinase [Sulfuritalea sp.]|nr:glucokinase [Sulfuritalea sp.]
MILGGDIGGTKTLLGIKREGELVIDRRYTNADFSDFAALLAAFFADAQTDPSRITSGCLAVAGPIADDRRSARLTNLPWTIDSQALAERFKLPRLRLENDFAAAALGSVGSSVSQRFVVQPGKPLAAAPCLVLGAGTGLGMAVVLPENGHWRVIAGEGGHAAFAPADERQMALWEFLRARHGRVTWERVVSGPGIVAIHEFISGTVLAPEDITARALTSPDSVERQTVELFLSTYGAIAGDMALACLPRGGVFLAGGIISRLIPILSGSGFLNAFNAKAEHADIAKQQPIFIPTEPLLGLHGAFGFSQE